MRRILPRLSLAALVLSQLAACEARLPEPESQGAVLYTERCSGCHRLYAPELMTAEMWKITVRRMQGELVRRGLPALSTEEQAVLVAYLEKHSGRPD